MSSIYSVNRNDRSDQNEEIRRIRDDYYEKETEANKRQKSELRRQAEKYEREIEGLRRDYNNQLDEARSHSKEALTFKDGVHQKEIEKIRNLYMDQIQKKAQEHEAAKQAIEEAYKGQIEKGKEIHEQQFDALKKNVDAARARDEKNFEDYAEQAQKEMNETIFKNKTALEAKQKDQIDMLRKVADDRVVKSDQGKQALQEYYSRNRIDQELQKNSELKRINNKWENAIKSQEYENDKVLTTRDQILTQEKNDLKKIYADRLKNKYDELDEAHELFKDQVNRRLERELSASKNKLFEESARNIADRNADKKISDKELINLQKQFETRMKSLNKEKGQILELANDLTHKRIENALNQSEKILNESNRNNKLKINVQESQNKEDRINLEALHKAELMDINEKVEKRTKNIIKNSTEAQQNQQAFHEKSLDQLRSAFVDRLATQREVQMQQLKDTYVRMDQKIRDREQENEKKLEKTNLYYQDRIAQQDEQMRAELDKLENSFKSKMKYQEKAHQQDYETQKLKYESKMASIQETHEKELDRLQRRHEEQMQSLATRVNANSRKV